MPKMSEEAKKPTVEEFLRFVPIRRDYPWSVDDQGLVHVTVPKFQSSLGKALCRLVRKDNSFQADMDAIGSFVWQRCDGKTSVDEILKVLKETFPDEKNIDQRLFVFLEQMRQLDYLDFLQPP